MRRRHNADKKLDKDQDKDTEVDHTSDAEDTTPVIEDLDAKIGIYCHC